MELLAHTENTDDKSHVFVLRVHSSGVDTTDGDLSVYGLQDQHLIDKMTQMSNVPKLVSEAEQVDVKLVTYEQLQKAGFLVEEDDRSTSPQEDLSSDSQLQNESSPQQPDDDVETAKYEMYSQLAGNGVSNNKIALNYVHNDIESSRNRRNYIPRRRQPFQLYKCDLCGSEFVHRTHLKIHQRTHTGEKPYKCQFCGRCFAQKGNLHVHMKIHTGEKDFICEYCQRAFITNAQLFVHMRTHTNPNRKRPYVTGRPNKTLPENGKSNSTDPPNQIIVQLIQPDNHSNENNKKKVEHPPDLQNSGNIPTLAVGEAELQNLSDENGAMNNLPSLQSVVEQPDTSYMRGTGGVESSLLV